MVPECQSLDAVVAEYRANAAKFEELSNPVLLVVGAELEAETATAVTAPGMALAPNGSGSFVVPLSARIPGAKKLSFGRSGVCDVVLPFGPISKHHGYFEKIDGGWTVLDVGSTNGTLVGGKSAATHALLLSDGVALSFGTLSARFLMPASLVTILKQRASLPR